MVAGGGEGDGERVLVPVKLLSDPSIAELLNTAGAACGDGRSVAAVSLSERAARCSCAQVCRRRRGGGGLFGFCRRRRGGVAGGTQPRARQRRRVQLVACTAPAWLVSGSQAHLSPLNLAELMHQRYFVWLYVSGEPG
ncbi:hypothetical protein BAE44_0018210 [Dichanthelium oligosanthes]|uniref:Uncharacterized protein n=1 Tax=Dichanthelium oligosanthes TaxID=888268 RepID=A0A1E5V6N0_9POAL|nr:hypothetical protein BAE44_0018210 [Dichanthelium oligosanthes]